MKTRFTLAACLLILFAGSTYAQKASKKFRIGLGVEGALPSTGLSAMYNFGAGATTRFAYSLDDKMAITLTTGAIAFLPKSIAKDADLKAQINIPIKAGFRYMITPKFYGIAETGVTIAKSYASVAGQTISATGSTFTYAPGIGVLLGGFDASLRYEGYTGAGFLGLRLGFNF